MSYNEAGNIGLLLNSLLAQELAFVNIEEIIVVASGCTDNTVDIVRRFTDRDKKIKLLVQGKRIGKMSAINLYLKATNSPIVSIINGDLLMRKDTVEQLISPFNDTKIGMTGGRVISLDKPDNLMGFAAHLLWGLHHEIALRSPKLGEAVAYRHLDSLQFPDDTVDDEGIVEAAVTQRGFQLRYVPEAVFYNKNPQKINEFFKRRRNIYAGHVQLKKRMFYKVSTMDTMRILKILPKFILKITGFNLKLVVWAVIIAGVEFLARIMGIYDFYILKRDHRIWEIAETSKRKYP